MASRFLVLIISYWVGENMYEVNDSLKEKFQRNPVRNPGNYTTSISFSLYSSCLRSRSLSEGPTFRKMIDIHIQ